MDNDRIISWWIRWEDLNWPNQDTHDRIRRRADQLAAANANAAMVFGTHFRWDWLPFFEILHDYLATVAGELHARGIKLYDHYSVNLVHRYDTRAEMRDVILHSGPHLPFSPSRSAAASWEFNGSKLNDWRMINTLTGEALYLPQYTAEGFCIRNPEFVAAHNAYAKKLVADTGIDGMEADDTVYYVGYLGCGCRHCRAALKERAGVDLPPPDDFGFWGNWDNPAWRAWIDLRYEAAGDFHRQLRAVLPEKFRLSSCCTGSSSPISNNDACDARQFLRGCNWQHLEMCGNIPPYKHDCVTMNYPISHHFINAAHHSAAAREAGVRCYSNGYGFYEEAANILWALNKCLGAECWFSTLKGRLGLPDSILAKLPDDASPAARSYTFEAEHPGLFDSIPVFQAGVYFSYETRNHSCFGNLLAGYSRDFRATMELLFQAGISAGAVLTMPEDTREYQLLLLPSAARITDDELARLRRFTAAGGAVLATGPSALPGADSPWKLPTAAGKSFWSNAYTKMSWKRSNAIPAVAHPTEAQKQLLELEGEGWTRREIPVPDLSKAAWKELAPGVFHHPARLADGDLKESLLKLVRKYLRPLPVTVEKVDGYLTVVHRAADGRYILHLLAGDFDTDIDRALDEIRFHRTRVNLITKVEPVNIGRELVLKFEGGVTVHTPFNAEDAAVDASAGRIEITLPEKCAYAVIELNAGRH